MLDGTKLKHALISTLLERWESKTHAFYLPCSECMITLDNVALQLDLLVDGLVVIGVIRVSDWSAICHQLLGKMSDKFSGSRIEMKWLKDNFSHLDNSFSEVERQQFTRAFILRLIGGLLMPSKSLNLVHLR
ncbi:hypothetical protein PVK06_027388 [Gossypium arboreum]|uniref:Aminotransferase-like plant mobile domain-containing protein n=1 Tax=Gossypium arboreum TaxID=29729 RepID=A0ABR0P1F2_GOSAR|nr:hypothetical protein PVK06_027388 [Gossypium arboreum]